MWEQLIIVTFHDIDEQKLKVNAIDYRSSHSNGFQSKYKIKKVCLSFTVHQTMGVRGSGDKEELTCTITRSLSESILWNHPGLV